MVTRKGSTNFKLGFTIVELLIVVVVIAILASITIVAYNGIRQRAADSALKHETSSAATRLSVYMVDNGQLPSETELETMGIKKAGSTYQYTVNNNDQTYCLAITTDGLTYHVTNTQSDPVSGPCTPSVAMVTNFIENPSFEANTPTYVGPNSSNITYSTTRAVSGTRSGLITMPTFIAGNVGIQAFREENVGAVLKPNTSYTISAYVYVPSGSTDINVSIQGPGILSGSISSNAERNATAKNQWVRVWRSITTGVNGSGRVTFYILNGTNATNGMQFWIDNIMLNEGDAPLVYADGNSPGWSWSGATNGTSSTGPAL